MGTRFSTVSRPVRAGLVICVLISAAWGVQQWMSRPASRVLPGESVSAVVPDHLYTVEAGTSARVKAGEKFQVMPTVLRARVGEVIRVVNNDSEMADVGPFSVPAGSTITQKLTRKGTFSGFCVLSATGRSQLIVE